MLPKVKRRLFYPAAASRANLARSDMNSGVREITCRTAAEFVARLRITDDLWGGQQAWDWGFRGQGNAGWPLLPSAFRNGTKLSYEDSTVSAPAPVPTDAQSGWQEYYEYKLIQHFLYLADRVGLGVPGDAQHFRLPPSSGNDRSLAPGDWPQPDVLETMAIAQHHGVPTRLLDITHNAFVAAFFAADDALDEKKVQNAPRFGVWAVDLSLVRQAVTLRVRQQASSKGRLSGRGLSNAVDRGRRLKPRVIYVTAPRADNSFLHHQDGLFLLDQEASLRRHADGSFEPLDEAIDDIYREVQSSSSTLEYFRPSPASPMVMVTAPRELAMDVLDLLDREFYNRARIMPTHDNVVKALAFHPVLNDHRRKTGATQAVYGKK